MQISRSMKTCTWGFIQGTDEPCGEVCEGRTEFCATHNRQLRKESENTKREAEKRANLIAKAALKNQVPRKLPNKVSPKREELNKEYKILREKFLKDHPNCELKLQPCTQTSTQVHHTASGWNKATNLNNVKTWKASCDNCNQFLHDKLSAKKARELGLKI